MVNVELEEKLQKYSKCYKSDEMHMEKPHYKIFKKKMRIVKSLVNHVQTLIPTNDPQDAKRLIRAAKMMLPSEYQVSMAKKEAPLMMALRGETPKSSNVATYDKVINELNAEVDEMLRKRYFPSRRDIVVTKTRPKPSEQYK